ncbi:MAG TPA: DUF423 domain-containing protein [Flavisolibacter sp.]|jgi:uncharacterized membrane protein YgdD (TMEM256/DUF423 family)|nr:DUF423 domain-containing protein [Flavisolibacter sp.]
MQKLFLTIGTLLAGLSVALGAFGAHGLKDRVAPEVIATYQTGVHYQMYHALALLVIGILSERLLSSYIHYAGFLFLAGIVFFSGSLYLIVSFQAMSREIPKLVGIATPIGGLLFIIGWILLLTGILKK